VLSNSLRLYIRHAWHVVEPSTVYLENWHVDLIAEHSKRSRPAQTKRLLIDIRKIDLRLDHVADVSPGKRADCRQPGKNLALEGPGTEMVRLDVKSATTRRRARTVISCGTFVVIRATAPCTAVSARPRVPSARITMVSVQRSL
jgi:hypothetical protein